MGSQVNSGFVQAKLGEREGKIENVTRLELIRAEQAKIEEEAAEQQVLEAERSIKEAEQKEKQARIAQVDTMVVCPNFGHTAQTSSFIK